MIIINHHSSKHHHRHDDDDDDDDKSVLESWPIPSSLETSSQVQF